MTVTPHSSILRLLDPVRQMLRGFFLLHPGTSGLAIGVTAAFIGYTMMSFSGGVENQRLKASFTGVSCGGAGDCTDTAACIDCTCELNGVNSECTNNCWNYCINGTVCDGQGSCLLPSSSASPPPPPPSSSSSDPPCACLTPGGCNPLCGPAGGNSGQACTMPSGSTCESLCGPPSDCTGCPTNPLCGSSSSSGGGGCCVNGVCQ